MFRKKNPNVVTRKILKSEILPSTGVLERFFEQETSFYKQKNVVSGVATQIVSLVKQPVPTEEIQIEIETNDVLFEVDMEGRFIFATHMYTDLEPEWIYFDDFVNRIRDITSQ